MDVDLSIPLTDLPRLSLGEWKDGETNLAEQVALLKEDFFGPLRKAMKNIQAGLPCQKVVRLGTGRLGARLCGFQVMRYKL